MLQRTASRLHPWPLSPPGLCVLETGVLGGCQSMQLPQCQLKGQQIMVDHARWASLSCAVQEMEAERSSPSAGTARGPGRGSGAVDTESVLETVQSPLPWVPGGPRGSRGTLGVESSGHPRPGSLCRFFRGSRKDFDNPLGR